MSMPLYLPIPQGPYAFRCINHEVPSHFDAQGFPIDSMTFDERWLNLTGVEPPIPPTAAYGGRGATVNLARGQPVRAYRCTICGYIELYDAHDVEPQTWGP